MRAVRRRLASFTALALLAGTLAAIQAPAAQAADVEQVIGDFETGPDSWSLNLGPEFPGAAGSFTQSGTDAVTGARSGVLAADFSAGGNYVQLKRNVPLDVKALSLQVRSAEANQLGVRITDSTGQTHQQRLPLAAGGDWQELNVTEFTSGTGYVHFGGANDGVWHPPAQSIAFVVDKGYLTTTDKKGQVRLDAISVTATPPDIEIGQTVPGNIFVQPDPVVLDLTSRGDSVSWSVRDFWGDEVASGDTAIETTAELTVPVETPGYYVLEATASLDGAALGTTETDLAILTEFDTPPVAESPFGVAEHLSRPDWGDPDHLLVDIADKAGATAVREDAGWSSIEAAPGEYGFDRYDSMVAKLRDGDLEWFPMFGYTNANYDENSTPYTDAGRQAYADYTLATVEHYDLPWAEVYNEFNIAFGDRGTGPADSRADYYFPMLKTTYETVKAARPDVTVVGGATSSVPLQWLEQLFALGGLDYMDVLSVHPYVFPGDPEGMEKMLQDLDALVREYNDGETIPIWITEQGWPTSNGATGVSEATQAENVTRANVIALSQGVDRFFYYNMMNKGLNPADVEHRYGLIRHTDDPRGKWAPKPGYVAYAAMTRQLTGATYDRAETIADGVESHVFDTDAAPLRVVWSEEPVSVTVQTNRPVTVTDVVGDTRQYTPTAGQVHLSLSSAPIYLSGDVRSVDASNKLVLRPVADGGTVAAGDSIELELAVDNTISPRTPVRGSFEIAGTSVPVNVRSGQKAVIPVSVPASQELGARQLVGTLDERRGDSARLTTGIEIVPPLSLTTSHRLNAAGEDVLHVAVVNASRADATVESLTWTIGDATGTAEIPAAVPGGSTHEVDIPLAGIPAGRHAREVRLAAPEVPDVVSTGTVAIVAADTVTSMPQTTITVDGVLDDLAGVPGVDLLTDGTLAIPGHAGPDDLGGQFWTTWDEENFYLSARIDDDVHDQPNSGSGTWFGDGFQFGLATGLPGETRAWDELGIALTADGPELYRWLVAEQRPVGVIEDAELAVVRNEDAEETVYELAIPWSELTPFAPADRLLSFALILNENDGAGRRGWIRWGDGIATTKDPARYNPMRLDPLP